MFHKPGRLNLQPAKFKIKSTLLNIEAKVIKKTVNVFHALIMVAIKPGIVEMPGI